MASNENFKVIIAGGGVAGLTLANMLESFDIQYVLLEAHSAIAPPVGASIGLFPNGLRIMDQLGCYEAIERLSQQRLNKGYTWDDNGKVIGELHYMFDHLEHRHGYGLNFFDRQQLLQILYDHIQHKDRILVKKQVTGIELIKEGVNVTTADGSTYSGSLVVGADGIHSKVRSIMKALGNKLQPGYFPPDEEDRVPCYYRCSFGIAQHVPGWVPGTHNIVTGKGQSQLVVSGPEDRVYWFLFDRLPEVKYGKDIPKYTKQDEAEFVKENSSRSITGTVTVGHLFANRLSSALTPLHEVVFKKWFFKRMITLGDSAHKPNPLNGQGGNAAIESCAELVNAILRKRNSRGGSLDGLTDEDILDIFTDTQSARHDRAELIVRESHQRQAIEACESPIKTALVQKVILPLLGKELPLSRMARAMTGGSRLEDLPVPRRVRAIPFHDELPAKPIPESVSNAVRWGFIGSMGLVLAITRNVFRLPFSSIGGWGESGSIVIPWLGKTPASEFLNVLVSVFSFPVLDKDPSPNLHLMNFLPQLISPLLIYTIEGYRLGNRGSFLALPSLFTAGMQVQGIGRIAPLHAILSALFGTESIPGRTVPKEVAMSLVPAITLGFVLPTIMSLWPTENVRAWQHWVAVWQFAPPLVNLLTAVFSSGLRTWRRRQAPDEHDAEFECYQRRDVPVLQRAYIYAFAVQSTVHMATMAYAWSHPGISIAKTFFSLPNPFKADWNLGTVSQQVSTFFRYDAVTAWAGYVGGNLYGVWDLRRAGYITTRSAVKAALAVVAGQVLVGPGATWAALWSWREDVIADLAQ